MALKSECSKEGDESAFDGKSYVKCLKARKKKIELLIISSIIFYNQASII